MCKGEEGGDVGEIGGLGLGYVPLEALSAWCLVDASFVYAVSSEIQPSLNKVGSSNTCQVTLGPQLSRIIRGLVADHWWEMSSYLVNRYRPNFWMRLRLLPSVGVANYICCNAVSSITIVARI